MPGDRPPLAPVARAARLVAVALVAVVGLLAPNEDQGAAQTAPSGDQVPTQDIVPQPDTGVAPDEAGDRGGALQLLLPVVIVVAIGGGVWHLSRQTRQAREARRPAGR